MPRPAERFSDMILLITFPQLYGVFTVIFASNILLSAQPKRPWKKVPSLQVRSIPRVFGHRSGGPLFRQPTS
jgi:hypothetical protein